MDVLAVFGAASELIERARRGDGPSYLVCRTYRFHGHHVGDPLNYREKEEVERWREQDPIERVKQRGHRARRARPRRTIAALEQRIEAEIDAAVEFAKSSPDPIARSADDGHLRMTAVTAPARRPPTTETRTMTYAEALNEALREEMRRDATVFVMGEDVAVWGGGGVFGVTKGLVEEFGTERVRDTPISEEAIAAVAVGAAATGSRPVAEIMYVDFIGLAMEPIVNQAAKMRYMFGGKAKVPMVIRAQEGAGRGNAAQHSQSLEAWFCHIPGPEGGHAQSRQPMPRAC